MRYGLLALSIAMLTGGGVAAQSALAISYSAEAKLAYKPQAHERTASYGTLPYTAPRGLALR
jgi:hypothetical protein